MSTIITPKDIIESLVTGNVKSVSFKPWENNFQKWLFCVSLLGLTLGALVAGATHLSTIPWLPLIALVCLMIAQIVGLLYQLSVVLPSLKMLRNTEKSLATPATEKFNDDIDRIISLANDFDQHHLNYARDRLALISEQLRQRIAFTFGAIDKVGVLPSAITGFFYLKDVMSKPPFTSSGIEWLLIAFVAFYIFTSYLIVVCQRLDRLVLILRHAASKKEHNANNEN